MIRFVVAVGLTLALLGCASSGTEVDPAKVQAFQKGKTTYGDVFRSLGLPQTDFVANDGTRVVSYTNIDARPRAVDFIPYIGLLAGGSDAKTSEYVFDFDKDGVLTASSAVSGQKSFNTGLLNRGE